MAEFTAKDVQALRQASGAGMMDAKKALTANDGDFEAAAAWLREQGLAKAAARSDRESTEGSVEAVVNGETGAIVELRCETDFVAKSDDFVALVGELAQQVAEQGEQAAAAAGSQIDDMRIALKENIELGRVVRFEAPEGSVLDAYVHRQAGRGINGVLVELTGGPVELAHDVALHIASSRPQYLRIEDVPAADVAAERETLENLSRNEGKPEQALPKIVEGRLRGWYAERVLLEQKFVKDVKQTVGAMLGDATVTRYAQVEIGS